MCETCAMEKYKPNYILLWMRVPERRMFSGLPENFISGFILSSGLLNFAFLYKSFAS